MQYKTIFIFYSPLSPDPGYEGGMGSDSFMPQLVLIVLLWIIIALLLFMFRYPAVWGRKHPDFRLLANHSRFSPPNMGEERIWKQGHPTVGKKTLELILLTIECIWKSWRHGIGLILLQTLRCPCGPKPPY